MNKQKIDEILNDFAININDYYILADASLVIRGIKERCLDLKLCVTKKVLEELKSRYNVKYIEGTQDRIFKVTDEVEIFVEEKENFECEIIKKYPLENIEKILKLKKQINHENQDIVDIEKYINNLKYETCCGAYVIDNGKVLLVQHKNGGHWDFPKGHMESGETKEETAIREVLEETGVKIKIVSKEEYQNKYKPEMNIQKTVIFFEAERVGGVLSNQKSEVTHIEWLGYKEALDKITFEQSKNLFKKFLEDKKLI